MGTKNSILYNQEKLFQNFRKEDWQYVSNINSDTYNEKFGEYGTLKNKITRQQIDVYDLYFQSDKQYKIYLECLTQRIRQCYLVNVVNFQPHISTSECSSIYSAKCYIQHIPVRLSSFTDLPFTDGLYILSCALMGFQILYSNVGYFQVQEDHICIDKEGQVRVWMNTDLSKNYPYGFDDAGSSKDNENIMVTQIIEMVLLNSDQGDNSERIPQFSTYIKTKGYKFPNFREAIELLSNYIKLFRIQLPTFCESVIEIFNDQFEDYFIPNNSVLDLLLNQSRNTEYSKSQLSIFDSKDRMIRGSSDQIVQKLNPVSSLQNSFGGEEQNSMQLLPKKRKVRFSHKTQSSSQSRILKKSEVISHRLNHPAQFQEMGKSGMKKKKQTKFKKQEDGESFLKNDSSLKNISMSRIQQNAQQHQLNSVLLRQKNNLRVSHNTQRISGNVNQYSEKRKQSDVSLQSQKHPEGQYSDNSKFNKNKYRNPNESKILSNNQSKRISLGDSSIINHNPNHNLNHNQNINHNQNHNRNHNNNQHNPNNFNGYYNKN